MGKEGWQMVDKERHAPPNGEAWVYVTFMRELIKEAVASEMQPPKHSFMAN